MTDQQQLQHVSDSDLAALTEGKLSAAERAVVVEHLADCGDCREVLALTAEMLEADALPPRASSGAA